MTAQPDDLMALADVLGVTRPKPLHPSMRGGLADAELAATLEQWAAEAPIPYLLVDCTACGDTGVVESVSWVTKRPSSGPCLACSNPDGGA